MNYSNTDYDLITGKKSKPDSCFTDRRTDFEKLQRNLKDEYAKILEKNALLNEKWQRAAKAHRESHYTHHSYIISNIKNSFKTPQRIRSEMSKQTTQTSRNKLNSF